MSDKMRILFGMRDDGDMTEPMSIMLLSALAKKHVNSETGLWVMERDNLEQARRIKTVDKHPKIIVGGPHFTFFPGEIVRNECIDALCVGEGDDAWVEWLKALQNNLNPNEIPNMVTRENMERVLKNPKGQISGMVDYGLDRKFMRGGKKNLEYLQF